MSTRALNIGERIRRAQSPHKSLIKNLDTSLYRKGAWGNSISSCTRPCMLLRIFESSRSQGGERRQN
jgi:hypothetical protein